MEKENKTITKKLISLISVLFIGALGSGLWDIFLKKLFFGIGEIFVKLMSNIYSGYIDSLYKNVGRISLSPMELLPSIFITVMIISMPVFSILWINRIYSSKRDYKPNIKTNIDSIITKKIISSKRRVYLLIFFITIPFSVFYTDLLIKELSCMTAKSYIERTTEIIRPYISEQEFLILRSEYRQIDNKNKLQNVINQINKFAVKNRIKLPEHDFYGISTK